MRELGALGRERLVVELLGRVGIERQVELVAPAELEAGARERVVAVARAGTADIGPTAEKPEMFGRLLIFLGLAEGIAIYGLIVSILILNRLA